MSGNRVLHLDFETFCNLDLRKVGLENYLEDSSLAVTALAWAFDGGPVSRLLWPNTQILPAGITAHIAAGGEVRGWNVSFERAVLIKYGLDVSPEQCVCVMQKALAYGLPAKLLDAGKAMKAKHIKDESKRALMLQMSRPRKGGLPWHETDPVKLAELAAYCSDDVLAERCLDDMIPDLHPFERRLSVLDMKMNEKGVRIDRDAVAAMSKVARIEESGINHEAWSISQGEITNPGTQTSRLLTWFANEGLILPDVTKETIEGALRAPGRKPKVHWMLELRALAAKASTAKLNKMWDVASFNDQRARNLFQFYGASRTGRWAGRLIQPQNLPRVPKGFNAEQFIMACQTQPDEVGMLWERPLDCVSQSLRSCFVAEPGKVLVSVDLSQIEARVLAWLAGQQDVLDAFRKGEDVYTLAAAKVGSSNRQLGKVLTLACGYGMGAVKFRETAAAAPYYIDLSEVEAERHLLAWRGSNTAIVGYWTAVQRWVETSMANPGRVVQMTHGMAVRTWKGVTQIRKPNGVKLTYHDMRWDGGSLVFSGVNSLSKKWGREKAYGGRLVENLVQSVARDVMAEAMLADPHVPVMTVHDEIVWEVAEEADRMLGNLMRATVETPPAWAKGLPLASELNVGVRYAK